MQEFDIELALPNIAERDAQSLVQALPGGFNSEDRNDLGWGTVIRTSSNQYDSFSRSVMEFLTPLVDLRSAISKFNGVLRVAVFHDKVTRTDKISPELILLLHQFALTLEISVYPSKD